MNWIVFPMIVVVGFIALRVLGVLATKKQLSEPTDSNRVNSPDTDLPTLTSDQVATLIRELKISDRDRLLKLWLMTIPASQRAQNELLLRLLTNGNDQADSE